MKFPLQVIDMKAHGRYYVSASWLYPFKYTRDSNKYPDLDIFTLKYSKF